MRNFGNSPNWILWTVIPLALVIFLAPIGYLFLTSIKPTGLLFSVPPRFVFAPDFGIYRELFLEEHAGKYLLNSLIVTTISTAISTALGAIAALVLALIQFRFKRSWFFVILITRMYPPVTTLIPIYLLMRYLGLTDTYPALFLPYAGTQLALATWIMWSYYKDVPVELFEAAVLDGCSAWQLLTRIAVPLSTSGLAACAVLIFILDWNEFLFALVLTSTEARTAPVALMAFLEQEGMVQWGSLAAMGSVMITPILIFVFVLRRYLVQGLTVGATKG